MNGPSTRYNVRTAISPNELEVCVPVHELAIAENIVRIVEESVRLDQGERVLTIEVAAGKMTGIVTETLEFCFGFAAKDTIADGARLVVETVPLGGRCRKCSAEFEIEDLLFACPSCASTDIKMVSGDELYVKQVEVN